jgi:eukaryotic-like serine/threonine-protein kinase
VKYYGGGTHEGQRWYAMEFIDGGSLSDLLKKKKRLSWDQAIQVGRQLCSALEHAHNAGIIHRDLKPANLFITRKGRIKLGDFGIARDTEATALTAAGKTVGTYAYMAPEQIQGNTAISRKTDLYATGCLLYEVLTGETPFVSENPAEMLMMHLNDDPYNVREKVADCPLALDALIERLLLKNPDDRPYDALAVHTELTEILKRAQEPVVPVSEEALASSGASKPAAAQAVAGEQKAKKKKKKQAGAFYESTWFLATCLVLLIAGGIWLSLGPGENDLYLQAKEAMTAAESVVQFDDAKRLFLQPYLEKHPEGRYVTEVRDWLDDVEVAILEEQVATAARLKRDDLTGLAKMCVRAISAERDTERNPLDAIDLYQEFIANLDATPAALEKTGTEKKSAADTAPASGDSPRVGATAEPRHWKVLAERHRDVVKETLLARANLQQLTREHMVRINSLLTNRELPDGESTGLAMLQRFRDVFRGHDTIEPWREYAQLRMKGVDAPMPGSAP